MKPVTMKDIEKGHQIVCEHSVEIGEYCDVCKQTPGQQVITLLLNSHAMTMPVYTYYLERIGAMEDKGGIDHGKLAKGTAVRNLRS